MRSPTKPRRRSVTLAKRLWGATIRSGLNYVGETLNIHTYIIHVNGEGLRRSVRRRPFRVRIPRSLQRYQGGPRAWPSSSHSRRHQPETAAPGSSCVIATLAA